MLLGQRREIKQKKQKPKWTKRGGGWGWWGDSQKRPSNIDLYFNKQLKNVL